MNAKTLSLALCEVDERFITEAINYQCKAKRRPVWTQAARIAAMIALACVLTFGSFMAVSAEFRERVIEWIVETYEQYSVFEIKGDENVDTANPLGYTFTYLPEGAKLIDKIEDDDFADYGYEVNGTQEIDITICPANYRVYVDTEGAEIHPLQIGDLEGYWLSKDALRYVCFELDGCQFSINGTVDIDELMKVAASVERK